MFSRKYSVLLLLFVLSSFSFLLIDYCRPRPSSELQPETNEYVGDQQCQNCHKRQYNEWKTSDHYKAMLPPTDSTVLGDFNNKSFTADGVTSRLYRKGNKFIIHTEGTDGKLHDFEVAYTFGHYPLQQYLITFPGGRMQVPRLSWNSKDKKWFHQYAGQDIHAGDWLHWTRGAQNWNTMCASCHSTNLQKNYLVEADSFHTTYSIINVSCESCHGQGRKHINYVRSPEYKNGKRVAGAYLQIGKSSTQTRQINTCAPCHALRTEVNAQLANSDELLDNYIPQIPSGEQFYADGQVKGEVYIYTSFLQSKMYKHGVKCSNCHNPHSARILFPVNQLCLQCHNKNYDATQHHFHTVNTKAAECTSCHMPSATFMGNDNRHDHSFRVPRPDLTVQYNVPNACNQCHNNKSGQWAAKTIEQWYGPKRKSHFADHLLPGSKQDQQSETHLIALLTDTATPPIIKATALSYLSGIITETSALQLRKALLDNNALIRYQSLRSLASFPATYWQNSALSLLNDKVRAVRIAAADLYLTIPIEQVPENLHIALSKAKAELDQYLLNQSDFASGNVLLADHYLRLSDYENAGKFYLRGLRMDSLMNYARLNLSSVYSAQGKNSEALKMLQAAQKIDPGNERIYYNLGLLYNEMKNNSEAEKSFERAIFLKSSNPRLYYNYGLLLLRKGEIKKAERTLLKGLEKSAREADLNYALAYLYIKSGEQEKAKKYVHLLKQIAPDHADYQPLFRLFP